MLIVALSFLGIGLLAMIGAGIYASALPDVAEEGGLKRYSFPPVALKMTTLFMVCLALGLCLIPFVDQDASESDDSLKWILPFVGVGFCAYYLLVERKQQAANFLSVDAIGLHWREGKREQRLDYADMASAYLPQMTSFKRYFKQGRSVYALTITDESGKVYEINPAKIGSARGTRYIVTELRRRLEAAGVPYTT